MRRIICLLLCCIIILGQSGCQRNTDPPSDAQPDPTQSTPSTQESSPSTDACEHVFAVTSRKDSTCTEGGYEESTCTLCGYKESVDIEAKGHSFQDATCTTPRSCDVCGIQDGEALGHRYVENICMRCGDDSSSPSADCEHTFRLTDKVADSCTQDGSVTYTCTKCKYFYTEALSAFGHNYTEAGCLTAKTCTTCGITIGNALGHSYGADYLCIRCGSTDPNKPVEAVDFTLTVRNKSSNGVPGVTVTVFVDDSTVAAGNAQTGSDGKAVIPLIPGSSYRVTLSTIPSGYSCKGEYTFRSLTANVTLDTLSVLDPNDHSGAQYKVGSTMGDFTLTDTNGITYNLYDLLETKNVVILNFFFNNCGPCLSEFPYFDEFSQLYGDEVQLLALNPIDREADIKQLNQQLGYSFPMIYENIGMGKGFKISAYPTTVVIGNNGKILQIHVGAFTRDEVQALFESYAN